MNATIAEMVNGDAALALAVPETGEETMPLDEGLLRELLEEFRHGTAEMVGIHADFKRIEEILAPLAEAIMGKSGRPGLITQMAMLEQRMGGVERTINEMGRDGTPSSRGALQLLAERQANLVARLGHIEAHVEQLEKERQERDKEQRGRWVQVALWIGTSIIALMGLVGTIVSFIKHAN